MKFILFLKVKDPWLRLSQLNFYQIDPFFYKTDKIERVTRIVCMTHGFGLAVSSCHCFTDLLSSSIHFVFAGLERGKYEDPEVGEGDLLQFTLSLPGWKGGNTKTQK